MTDADKLAQVLAEHDCYRWRFYLGGPDDAIVCTCGTVIPEQDAGYAEDWHRAHLAAVVLAHLTAEGWAHGREEWGVMVDEPTFVDHGRLIKNYGADREAAEEFSAPWRGVKVSRRRVTDWEPVETGGQE